MAATYTYPTPDVAAAMEASAADQVKIIACIMGFMGFCWVILGAFFLYHFCRPLKTMDVEAAIELRDVNSENEKKWWVDEFDADRVEIEEIEDVEEI